MYNPSWQLREWLTYIIIIIIIIIISVYHDLSRAKYMQSSYVSH